jgi:SanA protein
VLRDRVATAAELYFTGKIEKLLMSGDNRFHDYNEPAAMQDFAISLGVPKDAIVLDYAGRRTYDTCYRAKHIFMIDQAILVTQKFHLPRALYLCNQLGIEATGVSSDRREYRKSSLTFWNLRELPATLSALWEVHITKPLPVLGKPEPIFPKESL